MTLFNVILGIVGFYMLAGFLFAIPFVIKGAGAIDPVAKEGTWGFKLLIIPGVVIFWPWLAKRWMTGAQPPEECNAHRACTCKKSDTERTS